MLEEKSGGNEKLKELLLCLVTSPRRKHREVVRFMDHPLSGDMLERAFIGWQEAHGGSFDDFVLQVIA